MRYPPAAPDWLRPWAGLWSAAWTLAMAGLLGWAMVAAWVPPQHLPWTPLVVDQPIGLATGAKLRALRQDPAGCLAVLEQAGVTVTPAPDTDDDGFCVVENAVRVREGLTPLAPSGVVMRCPLAAAVAIWDRQVLQPAAREELGTAVAAIDNYGTYACRRVYGSTDASRRPSEHARANALDVAGFRLEDGRRVTVVAHWEDEGAQGRFLRRVRDGGCRLFGSVLGPEYNAAHADHLHLDNAPFTICS